MFKRIDPDGEPKKQVVDDSDDDDDDDLDNLDSYVNANSNANPPGDDDTVDSEFERNRMIQVYGGRSQ